MTTQKLEESLAFINSTINTPPKGLVILGTGLRDALAELDEAVTIPYSQIPHFPIPTVATHEGELVIGKLQGYPLAVMRGRVHYYEGYTMAEVTYPLRVLHALGARTLVVTNAAGALNINFKLGDIVIISDHINLMGDNPLRGVNDVEAGTRFPLMTQAYDPELIDFFSAACLAEKAIPRFGVYVALSGPNLETPAELRFLHSAGADLVGMSTVPEVIQAVQLGIRVLGVSVVSNLAVFLPQRKEGEVINEINRTVNKTSQILRKIFKRFFREL